MLVESSVRLHIAGKCLTLPRALSAYYIQLNSIECIVRVAKYCPNFQLFRKGLVCKGRVFISLEEKSVDRGSCSS